MFYISKETMAVSGGGQNNNSNSLGYEQSWIAKVLNGTNVLNLYEFKFNWQFRKYLLTVTSPIMSVMSQNVYKKPIIRI